MFFLQEGCTITLCSCPPAAQARPGLLVGAPGSAVVSKAQAVLPLTGRGRGPAGSGEGSSEARGRLAPHLSIVLTIHPSLLCQPPATRPLTHSLSRAWCHLRTCPSVQPPATRPLSTCSPVHPHLPTRPLSTCSPIHPRLPTHPEPPTPFLLVLRHSLCSVAQVGLELAITVPSPLVCWIYMCGPPCLLSVFHPSVH